MEPKKYARKKNNFLIFSFILENIKKKKLNIIKILHIFKLLTPYKFILLPLNLFFIFLQIFFFFSFFFSIFFFLVLSGFPGEPINVFYKNEVLEI